MSATRWQILSAAPHRMMMFGGAVQLLATLIFWGSELVGRYTSLWAPLPTTISSTAAHAFLMLYTLFPFFIFGFLMTTYPRWMSGTAIPQQRYSRSFLLLGSGVVLFYLGLLSAYSLIIIAVLLVLAGYLYALYSLWQVYRTAPARDKFYETLLNVALGAGATGVIAYLLWLFGANVWTLHYALTVGLWWFLLPIAISVSHRMIPFFSVCVLSDYTQYQPKATLGAMLLLVGLHGLLELIGLAHWSLLVDVPLLVLTVYHSVRWQFRRSFAVRLLAILHIAFAWLSIAMVLYVIQGLSFWLDLALPLGRAPLHAIAIGFLLSLTLAMASRVTLGHSGRELRADTTTWVLFWGLGLVAILRIVAELPFGLHANLAAAVAWLLLTITWVVKYGPMYLRPRVDGKPG